MLLRGSYTAWVISMKMDRMRRRMLLLRILGTSGQAPGLQQAFTRKSWSTVTFSKVPVSVNSQQ